MKRGLIGIAALIAASSLAGTAAAVDGVIEINQTCAVNTGCHPSDPPGFPVRIPVGASYRLTSDLVISDGNVTVIEGFVPTLIGGLPNSNGTLHLDLNGFSIRCFVSLIVQGGASCGGIGVGVNFGAISGATVVNGTVKNMGNDGILLGNSGRVHGVYASSNSEANDGNLAGIRCGNGCQVSQCVVDGNRSYGLFTGNGSVVTDSQVLNNQWGMRLGSGSVVTRNAVYANTYTGIIDTGGSAILQNAISANGGYGIDSLIGAPFAYGHNALRGNNGNGVESDGLGIQVGPNLCDTDAVCP